MALCPSGVIPAAAGEEVLEDGTDHSVNHLDRSAPKLVSLEDKGVGTDPDLMCHPCEGEGVDCAPLGEELDEDSTTAGEPISGGSDDEIDYDENEAPERLGPLPGRKTDDNDRKSGKVGGIGRQASPIN